MLKTLTHTLSILQPKPPKIFCIPMHCLLLYRPSLGMPEMALWLAGVYPAISATGLQAQQFFEYLALGTGNAKYDPAADRLLHSGGSAAKRPPLKQSKQKWTKGTTTPKREKSSRTSLVRR